ncbi:peptidase M20B, tripeptide aminopeptidase [Kipferlia bialata]|uniref:Peptidase M20B, tripeptide aminopeptidase n=1 Tax=Kipferlia bialata TaxID=797122 RepID=A0A9K3GL12_9EUKA|nr:peptidase M20B, tripeptide aminopeptidase [Kipferlia bialata]|eukprot:g8825.t1
MGDDHSSVLLGDDGVPIGAPRKNLICGLTRSTVYLVAAIAVAIVLTCIVALGNAPEPAPPADIPTSLLERFLEYVKYDTQSDDYSMTAPSTDKQLVLGNRLVVELKALGLVDATLNEYGIVMATLPASPDNTYPNAIGLIAHMDTSPDASGYDVKPLQWPITSGMDDIVLPSGDIIPFSQLCPVDTEEDPCQYLGQTLITSSGDTLLGADDKAGISVIMSALDAMIQNDSPHPTVRVAFTPDEEVGRGADNFDVDVFNAFAAYTVDGGVIGELEDENFNAESGVVTFNGFNVHPGSAKDVMKNSVRAAASFISCLPAEYAPETTEDREPYIHPNDITPVGVTETQVHTIVRSFSDEDTDMMKQYITDCATQAADEWEMLSHEVEFTVQYKNMKPILDEYPEVMDLAIAAYNSQGVTPDVIPIRGGTDGARLSYMGLPTPNMFTGAANMHSVTEWVVLESMLKCRDIVVDLMARWSQYEE